MNTDRRLQKALHTRRSRHTFRPKPSSCTLISAEVADSLPSERLMVDRIYPERVEPHRLLPSWQGMLSMLALGKGTQHHSASSRLWMHMPGYMDHA